MMNLKYASLLAALIITAPAANAADGEAIYMGTCVACHGTDGAGMIPGTPDFTSKSGPLAKTDAVLIANISNGFQTPGSPMAMPPKGGNPNMTEEDVGAVLAYIRKSFGQ